MQVPDIVVGTYWIVLNQGSIWIAQGDKPTPEDGGFMRHGKGMGWLDLGNKDDYTYKGEDKIYTSNFDEIEFPDLIPDEPVEIEIVKSGRVYIY